MALAAEADTARRLQTIPGVGLWIAGLFPPI
jgi:hypothetical protein